MAGAGGAPGGGGTTSAGAAGGSGAKCRVYASKQTYTQQSGSTKTEAAGTCTFDRTALQMTCITSRKTTTTSSDGGMQMKTSSSSYRTIWPSLEAAINSGSPIGRVTYTKAFYEGECPGTATVSYDGQGRPTQVVNTFQGTRTSCPVSDRWTYSDWDADGRPRTQAEAFVFPGCSGSARSTVIYDDATSAVTESSSSTAMCLASGTKTSVYDADGLLVSTKLEGASSSYAVSYESIEKQMICP